MDATRRAVVLVLLSLCALVAHAADFDEHKVLQLSPAEVPALAGIDAAQLRLAAFRDGRLLPVPFQVDEYSEAGLPWFPGVDLRHSGREGVFDGQDRLLLVAGDAARAPLPAGTAMPAGWLGELAFTLQGETRYVQLFAGNDMPLSERSYVRHNRQAGVTETPFYTLRVDPKNELNWKYLMVRSWRGDQTQSLIDTLKMRISGGVLAAVARVTLDNDNLRPKVVGFKVGPIRSVMQLETTVVIAGLPVMRMQVQVHRYPRQVEAYTHARIPRLYRATLREPEVRVTIDGNNLKGARVRTARSNGQAAMVDGRMDPVEQQIVARGLSASEDWILFDTRGGFSMFTFLNAPPELRNVPLQLVYLDDPEETDPPEQFPGQSPNIGYGLRGFPPGEDFRFGVTLVFDGDIDAMDPQAYAARWRERPACRFTPAPST